MSALIVEVLGVTRGGRRIVHDVSFQADRGDVVAVMGASGAGKSTVLRAVAGLDAIEQGTVAIEGLRRGAGPRPRGAELKALHDRVGIVFQFHHLFEHLTAVHNVWLAPVHVRGDSRAAAAQRARELLDSLGVGHRAEAMPHELSGGEAQRVAIARALAMNPPLLLMDEPTASLDPARRGDLAATLRRLAAEGRTIVVATHDEDFVAGCATRVVMMDAGRVVRTGTPAEVIQK